ncbi:MAG: inositol monophosphatase family protein [Syntrophales bacterium]
MTSEYLPCLNLAAEAAIKAGRFLLENVGKSIDVVREEAREIHFQFDLEAEKIIMHELQNSSAYRIITEESGVIDGAGGGSDHLWIVDPLDGSINYSEGIPLCCVSVSLWKESSPVLGVIYDFNHDHLYTGITDLGAWVNNRSIRVKPPRRADKAILCTGFPGSMDFSATAMNRFVTLVAKFRKIRMVGSAALSLAFVAAGKVDAYYEKNIKIWDVAAGLALVKSAGGDIICRGFPQSNIVEVFGASSIHLMDSVSI